VTREGSEAGRFARTSSRALGGARFPAALPGSGRKYETIAGRLSRDYPLSSAEDRGLCPTPPLRSRLLLLGKVRNRNARRAPRFRQGPIDAQTCSVARGKDGTFDGLSGKTP